MDEICVCEGAPHADTCHLAPDWRRVDDPPPCSHSYAINVWRNTYGDEVRRLQCIWCGFAKPLVRGNRTPVPRDKSIHDR